MNPLVKNILGAAVACQLTALAGWAQTTMSLGNLPLWFEAGQNGAAAATQFTAHGRDSQISITPGGAQFVLRQAGSQTASARMEFVNANPSAEISGGAELSGKINYLTGSDSSHWQSGLSTFGQVRVAQVYPGVNVVYYGNQQRLEYDFDLAPGAKPESIAIRFAGTDKVSVNLQGELVVELAGREIIQHQPVAYQVFGITRHEVRVGYKILDAHTVAFSVGSYNRSLPLVIDPVLSYSTFFGGNSTDIAWAVALGTNDGSVYIAGQTLSTAITGTLRFSTPGVLQTNFQGGGAWGDAFVAKFHDLGTNAASLNNLATNLIYCTYLGGNADDSASAIAVDGVGHVFVAGATFSPNFPVANAIVYQTFNGSNITGPKIVQPAYNGYAADAFVSELETNGSALIYSTYLGGESSDEVLGLTIDSSDNAYVTGFTCSTNFPVTSDAYQTSFAAVNDFYRGCNAFVTEIAAGGRTLNYSSYLGGTNVDIGQAISVNGNYVAVAGFTSSTNFPTTNYINQAFVQMPYLQTTNIAGTNYVVGTNFYNGGRLNSITNNSSNPLSVANDAFVASFTASGSSLTPRYVTLLGGANYDVAYGVAVDAAGNSYVVGATTSTNYPDTTNALILPSFVRTNYQGVIATNAFLTQVQWSGTNATVGYSQIFGGSGFDLARGVALDAAGNIFVVGSTTSLTNYTATTNNLIGSLTWTNADTSGTTADVFVTVFKADLSALLYSADFGSQVNDFGYGIAVGPDDSAYIVGQTLANSSQGFPIFNAWETNPPDANNAFLTKIWATLPALPALAANLSGTNLLVSWTSSPLAQYNTNSFYLETVTNLLSTVVMTNLPASTNLVSATNWTVVTQKPVATNGTYIFTFNPTNQMRFFRLQGFSY